VRGDIDFHKFGFDAIFDAEITKAGYAVDGDRSNLFETKSPTGEFVVGATINALDGDFLIPGFGSGREFKGRGVMRIEWQIYSRLQKRILYRFTTLGGAMTDRASESAVEDVLRGSFRENVRALIMSQQFRLSLIDSGPPAVAPMRPAQHQKIHLHVAGAKGPRAIADAVSAAVIVFAGDGHGSGFLVSSDGMLLTDDHVVGSARQVKIRWSDGAETVGEVIRTDHVRDVALIKTDAGDRQPLRVRTTPIQPGETVFAIGAPLDEEFQGTVTRGVVSASRAFDGLTYLQSDVTVNPGNSGGPLLDESGSVVGITEAGIRPDGVPSGLNLFTPIGSALEVLGAVQD
jgi:S1-C subfamily serine protease